jgi:DNA-binding beta-propeller fold protein YncE
MALSDDGAWLLVSAFNSAELFAANGGPRQLLRTGAYPLVSFAAGSHDAAVADPYRGALTVVRDVAGSSVEQSLAAPEGIRHARALAFSSDGKRLFLANPAERSVSVIEIASGALKTAACDCAPSGLTAMGKVVRLNETGAGPLWLLDAEAAAEPRVVFVPAAQ